MLSSLLQAAISFDGYTELPTCVRKRLFFDYCAPIIEVGVVAGQSMYCLLNEQGFNVSRGIESLFFLYQLS